MEPYRPLHVAKDPPEDDDRADDRVLAILLIVLGLARVIPAIALREHFGAEATVALVMLVAGLAILLGRLASRPGQQFRP